MKLSQDEDALIDFFRAMSAGDRAALLHVARSMAEREEAKTSARPKGFKPNRTKGGGDAQ